VRGAVPRVARGMAVHPLTPDDMGRVSEGWKLRPSTPRKKLERCGRFSSSAWNASGSRPTLRRNSVLRKNMRSRKNHTRPRSLKRSPGRFPSSPPKAFMRGQQAAYRRVHFGLAMDGSSDEGCGSAEAKHGGWQLSDRADAENGKPVIAFRTQFERRTTVSSRHPRHGKN
jgi:hypothetical protein